MSGEYAGFHIYLDPPASYTLPITVSMDTTFYEFDDLEDGVTYTVTVAAFNAGGDGPSVMESIQTIGQSMLRVYMHINDIINIMFFI